MKGFSKTCFSYINHCNCGLYLIAQCIKFIQNVSFEIFNFGIFNQFLPLNMKMLLASLAI